MLSSLGIRIQIQSVVEAFENAEKETGDLIGTKRHETQIYDSDDTEDRTAEIVEACFPSDLQQNVGVSPFPVMISSV